MLGNFVHSAERLFLMEAEKLVERTDALANRIGFFDGLGHVSLRENHRVAQLQSAGKLRGNRR